MNIDCPHGHLRRACESCDLAEEVATLKSALQRLHKSVNIYLGAIHVADIETTLDAMAKTAGEVEHLFLERKP